MILHWLSIIWASFCISLGYATNKYQPEQIHLAYGEDLSQMVVTWNTLEPVGAEVFYGTDRRLDQFANGTTTAFTDGGSEHRTQHIHRATMLQLRPETTYQYQVGSEAGWSELFWFTTPPQGVDWSPRLVVYGDLGSLNAQSLPRIQREVEQGRYDAVLHVGDFAYDMDSDQAEVGDEFMRQVQPIAGYLPYMTCPGNHEQKYNFSNYKARFSMPRDGDNMYYSFDLGPVHFVSVSSEYYYYLNYGLKMVANQYRWLVHDLQEATKPEARAMRPWIVMFGHRPMYCSNENFDDCTKTRDAMRVGIPIINAFGMESLLMQYGVDVAIWAHEHSYERLYPVYDYQLYNGTDGDPYRNPGAPVHFTTGSAGCSERHDHYNGTQPEWSAYRSTEYGYSRLHFINSTHLQVQQVSDDQGGAVIDSWHVIRESHKSYHDLKLTPDGYL